MIGIQSAILSLTYLLIKAPLLLSMGNNRKGERELQCL
jgi:hypothetical protein